MSNSASQHPNADVRMRGFAERVSVDAALAWLDSALEQQGLPGSEVIGLEAAAGRVLAEAVVSTVNVPDFKRAMMDGYALRSEDITAASDEQPVPLQVVDECVPGDEFSGEVKTGQAVRIMTGAAMPNGADSVLPVEQSAIVNNQVCALKSLPVGKNLGNVGEDIQQGDVLFTAGRVLRPQDVGVLSSIGQSKVSVAKQPRVRIIVTGSELLPVGEKPQGNRIVDANGPMLEALITRDGGTPNHPGIVSDDRDLILAAMQEDADVILTSGGSSVGQEDYVPTLLAEHGNLAVHGVAMRPAGPIGMGTLNNRLVILLPGNPVACLWGYDLFAGRAIRKLGRRSPDWPYQKVSATLTKPIKSPVGRLDYVRVKLSENTVEPVPASGASVLSSTTRADGFVVVPDEADGFEDGREVEVFCYD